MTSYQSCAGGFAAVAISPGVRWRGTLAKGLALLSLLVTLAAARSASAACELAIVLDETGSMTAARPAGCVAGTPGCSTRCKDSSLYASAVFNYYRCGSGSCTSTGTTATRPVDFFIDGSTSTAFDAVYDDPANTCSTIAGKRVNVYAFGGPGSLQSLTTGISGPDGWVDLSNNALADQVRTLILNQGAACTAGSTAVAQSLCDMVPILGPSTSPKKKLKFLTDGGENASLGACAGGEDSDGFPPFDVSSWQGKTFNVLSVSKWEVSATMFAPTGFVQLPGALDVETGHPFLRTPSADAAFFSALATATGGKATTLADDKPVSPIVAAQAAPPAPATSWWWLAVLVFICLAIGAGTLNVRREV